MAVILRNGATRVGTGTTSLPLRSATIKINQAGLVESLTGPDGKSVKTLNLGYQGDHNITCLYVKLWKDTTSDFANKYDAALVFFNEKKNISYTASMQRSDFSYFVNIPDAVTKDGGNYQMYFVLKESLSTGVTSGSVVGAEDDPSYREVFISEAWKGVVNEKSGFSLIPKGFDWEANVHNYEIGRITPFQWVPIKTIDGNPGSQEVTEEGQGIETGQLRSVIFLSGIKDGTQDDEIKITNQPSIIEVVSKTLTAGSPDSLVTSGSTLTLIIQFIGEPTEEAENKALDELVIEYPVTFRVNNFFEDSQLHKKAITVNFEPNSISVQNNENLGMKYDAYITPIKLNMLPNFPTTNKQKYVIFAKDGKSIVCKSLDMDKTDQYCWIPTQVTANAGTWEVSFVSKGWDEDANQNKTNEYVCYTGILKLKVIDNKLSKRDLETDTAYRALMDNDAQSLYDKNNYALYAISNSSAEVKLNYKASEINNAIGWALGAFMGESGAGSGVTPGQVINTVNDFNEVRTNYTEIEKRVTDLEVVDIKVHSDIADINKNIENIEQTLAEADVTIIKGTVDQNVVDIESLKERTTSLENKDTVLEKNIKTNTDSITKNKEDLNKVAEEIDKLKKTDIDLDRRVYNNESQIVLYGELISANSTRSTNNNARINVLERGLEDLATDVDNLITAEISRATTAENKLEYALNEEIERSKEKDDSLQSQLDAEKLRSETIDQQLDTALKEEIKERKDEEEKINTNISSIKTTNNQQENEISQLKSRIETIESDESIVRNDYINTPGAYVSRVVFIKPDTEKGLSAEEVYEELLSKGEVNSNTLYLIQEEV